MTRQQKLMLALGAGAAAMLAARRGLRNRHAISFEGRVVIITGGSRGLGLVLARQLAAEGPGCVCSRAIPRSSTAHERSSRTTPR